MKYAIVKVTDGNYNVHAEGITDLASAKSQYHALCTALWNDKPTKTATVMLTDENLDCVEGYRERISHPVDVEAEA